MLGQKSMFGDRTNAEIAKKSTCPMILFIVQDKVSWNDLITNVLGNRLAGYKDPIITAEFQSKWIGVSSSLRSLDLLIDDIPSELLIENCGPQHDLTDCVAVSSWVSVSARDSSVYHFEECLVSRHMTFSDELLHVKVIKAV